MHEVSLDDEYFPASHHLHSLDELEPDTAMLLPAPHVMQLDTFDAGLYLPGMQGVQLVAAVLGPVLVILPARHVRQLACALFGWYVPAGHAAALATPGISLRVRRAIGFIMVAYLSAIC